MAIRRIRDRSTTITTLSAIAYICIALAVTANPIKQKRQLFREHLLPHKGGKIPDSAFNPDRLALNRLNQQGISVPDGVSLDQRRQERHPFPKQMLPQTLKVVLMNDGRYVAPPGRYHYDKQPTIDTTYIIRCPITVFRKGSPVSQSSLPYMSAWLGAARNKGHKYYKQVDVTNWQPPSWYNAVSNMMWKNTLANDDIDPSAVLSEYSSYLEKLHRDYDK